jgi:hypothetical protein
MMRLEKCLVGDWKGWKNFDGQEKSELTSRDQHRFSSTNVMQRTKGKDKKSSRISTVTIVTRRKNSA